MGWCAKSCPVPRQWGSVGAAGDDGVTVFAVVGPEGCCDDVTDAFGGNGFVFIDEAVVVVDFGSSDQVYCGAGCLFVVLLDLADMADLFRGFYTPHGGDGCAVNGDVCDLHEGLGKSDRHGCGDEEFCAGEVADHVCGCTFRVFVFFEEVGESCRAPCYHVT